VSWYLRWRAYPKSNLDEVVRRKGLAGQDLDVFQVIWARHLVLRRFAQ